MDVLIKGMNMPKSCKDCDLAKHFDGYNENDCPFNAFSYYDCPLAGVPTPHGKLIDADELIRIAKKWIDHPDPYISKRNKDFIYFLEKADAVIEAEE